MSENEPEGLKKDVKLDDFLRNRPRKRFGFVHERVYPKPHTQPTGATYPTAHPKVISDPEPVGTVSKSSGYVNTRGFDKRRLSFGTYLTGFGECVSNAYRNVSHSFKQKSDARKALKKLGKERGHEESQAPREKNRVNDHRSSYRPEDSRAIGGVLVMTAGFCIWTGTLLYITRLSDNHTRVNNVPTQTAAAESYKSQSWGKIQKKYCSIPVQETIIQEKSVLEKESLATQGSDAQRHIHVELKSGGTFSQILIDELHKNGYKIRIPYGEKGAVNLALAQHGIVIADRSVPKKSIENSDRRMAPGAYSVDVSQLEQSGAVYMSPDRDRKTSQDTGASTYKIEKNDRTQEYSGTDLTSCTGAEMNGIVYSLYKEHKTYAGVQRALKEMGREMSTKNIRNRLERYRTNRC